MLKLIFWAYWWVQIFIVLISANLSFLDRILYSKSRLKDGRLNVKKVKEKQFIESHTSVVCPSVLTRILGLLQKLLDKIWYTCYFSEHLVGFFRLWSWEELHQNMADSFTSLGDHCQIGLKVGTFISLRLVFGLLSFYQKKKIKILMLVSTYCKIYRVSQK